MSLYSNLAEHYEMAFPFREEVYSFLKNHFGVERNRILDIGCGSGHYCGRFCADGFSCTGVDVNSEMIRVATSKFPDAQFRLMNMIDIDSIGQRFNGAYCIGNVLAYLSREELQRFLEKLRQVLNPDSLWIFQVVNWDYILEQKAFKFPTRVLGNTGLSFHRSYRNISSQGVIFETKLVKQNNVVFSDQAILHPLKTKDYELLHKQSGLNVIAHYANYQEAEFHPSQDSASIFVTTLSETNA